MIATICYHLDASNSLATLTLTHDLLALFPCFRLTM